MASQLTEDEIGNITDLFGAFKLMQKLDINPKGVTNLEDAKCRLLQYIREKYGVGSRRHTTATDLFQEVLEIDKARREELAVLYETATEYLRALPVFRRRELEKNVAEFDRKLESNLENVRRSDCAILVAGEVSAGKSSLLNLLLGRELLPTSLLSCTSVLCELRHSPDQYALAYPWDTAQRPVRIDLAEAYHPEDDRPGLGSAGIGGTVPGEGEGEDEARPEGDSPKFNAADILSQYIHQKGERRERFPYQKVEIYWPFPLLKGGIFIVDSPGIGESKEMTEVVKNFLPSAFAFIYVINSSNAGGLQPDRLQDLLATLSHKEDDLSRFDPRSAIFICNKWDQVPAKELHLVKNDTMEKLRRCWPGIRDSQVFYLSATKAAKSLQDSDFVTQDFSQLLEGIENLLPISLQCKLENHYRWLSQLLRRSAFHLRVHIANETRSDEEKKELTEHLHNQLDRLASDTKRVHQELKLELHKRAASARDQLIAHLASASTRTRLMQWQESECPDGDDWDILQEVMMAKINKRIRREVSDWDVKNSVFVDIQLELLRRFQAEYQLMEDQLDIIEGAMTGRGGRPGDTLSYMRTLQAEPGFFPTPDFSLGQKIALGFAIPLLIPLGVVAGMFVLPVAGVKAIRAKLQDMRLLKDYRLKKAETMSVMTDEILESFLEPTNLGKLIHGQLKAVTQNLDSMINSLPNLVESDRAMIDKLQEEREATETSLAEQYLPLYSQCQEIQGRLDYFYVSRIRQYDIPMEALEWDPSMPPIASGSFGDVHLGTWRQANDKVKHVAIKVRREQVDPGNVTDILIEEENLRKFQHPNIVTYYGTCVRRSDPREPDADVTIQFIMIMERCETTLRSRIVGKRAVSPGKLGHSFAPHQDALRKVAHYLEQTASALVYLHERALVHRDLKPQNILLTSKDIIKLADVGLTKPERDISGTKCGTVSYAAPEVLEGADYGKLADVYSMGVVAWELWYGRLAQDELTATHKGDIETAIRGGARPNLTSPHQPPEDWKTVIKACWAENVRNRPSAGYIRDFFHRASAVTSASD